MKIGCLLRENYIAIQRGIAGIGIIFGISVGVFLRYKHYTANRSLWLDPAALAVNIIERSYTDLLTRLDMKQNAPPGFLLVSKFVGSLFNYSELSLIAFPFACSILSLFLFLYLCSLVLDRQKIYLAFVPFALSTTAIYYAGEFKQYSVDLFFSVLLLALTFLVIKHRFGRRYLYGWILTGLVSVWFSHPAIIVLSGVWAAVFLITLFDKEVFPHTLKTLFTGFLWVLNYLILFFTVIYPSSLKEGMHHVFKRWFAPLPVDETSIRWYAGTFLGLFHHPLGFKKTYFIAAISLLIGIWIFYRKKRNQFLIFFFPLLILFVLSLLKRYPIPTGQHETYSRLILFAIPFFYIFIAEGAFYIADKPKWIPFYLFTVALLFFYSGTGLFRSFGMYEETRPLIEYYYKNRQGDDNIYVYAHSIPAFRYYNRLYKGHFIAGKALGKDPRELRDELKELVGERRIWFLSSHILPNVENNFVNYLDSIGEKVDEKAARGAFLYCYKFRGP